MKASVVLVNYNGGDAVVRFLKALSESVPDDDFEIILVDNASTDGSAAAIAEAAPRIRVCKETENRGFAAGTNRGLKEARGEVLIALNPDAVPEAGALERLTEATLAHSEFGILGGTIVSPRGRIDVCCARPLPKLRDILWEAFFLPKRRQESYRKLIAGAREPLVVGAVSGAAMAISRANLAAIGPMSEEYFLYNEDIEWCERSHRAGKAVVVVPDARFIHAQGHSTRVDERNPFAARMLADFQFFVEFRGEDAESVRWRWWIRQSFRSVLYGIAGRILPSRRRSIFRKREIIYRRLARIVRRLAWSTSTGANAHPSRAWEDSR